jgi:release factor glutamine methyltransferase
MPAAVDLPKPCTVGDFIDTAEEAIRASKHVELWKPWVARTDAEELVGIVLDREVAQDDLDLRLKRRQVEELRPLLARRLKGEPMALLRGYIDFRSLRIELRAGVFSPRLSSEFQAAEVIARLRRRARPVLVDVACGAGPVALAVAHALPKAQVWGLDISREAVELGRHNARRLGLDNVRFETGDLLEPLPSRLHDAVDAVSIHPPYVGRHLVKTLPTEIARYEPLHTLTDNSDDGLGLVRRLAAEAPLYLRRGGWLVVEIAPDMARDVAAIFRKNSFTEVRSLRESASAVTRVVVGRNDG